MPAGVFPNLRPGPVGKRADLQQRFAAGKAVLLDFLQVRARGRLFAAQAGKPNVERLERFHQRRDFAKLAASRGIRLIEYGVEQLVDVQALNLLRVQSQAHFGVPFWLALESGDSRSFSAKLSALRAICASLLLWSVAERSTTWSGWNAAAAERPARSSGSSEASTQRTTNPAEYNEVRKLRSAGKSTPDASRTTT